jgi:hypothetical protein
MLNRDSKYVEDYLNIVSSISQEIIEEDYSYLNEYKMPSKYGTVENGDWIFKIIKSKDTGITLKKSKSKKFIEFLSDSNVICVGISRFPPGTNIKEHVDPPYYGKNLWRILVPIQCEESYINEKNGPQLCQIGNCYIIDLLYEIHSGWNNSKKKDFIVCTIDLLYEDKSDYSISDSWQSCQIQKKKKDYKKAVKIDLSIYDKC